MTTGRPPVETVGVVLGGQTPRRGEIGHFQIGSLSSSRTISSGMGLVQGPYERIPRLVIQMEDMRLPDVPVGGDEQVGQRPLRGAESPELGRRSRRSFCDGVSRISKRLALLVISVMP